MNTTFSFAKYIYLISLEADVSEAISEITLFRNFVKPLCDPIFKAKVGAIHHTGFYVATLLLVLQSTFRSFLRKITAHYTMSCP